jgi:hypothetical protein
MKFTVERVALQRMVEQLKIERGVAGECELRDEEWLSPEFPGIGAGIVGQTQGGEHQEN